MPSHHHDKPLYRSPAALRFVSRLRALGRIPPTYDNPEGNREKALTVGFRTGNYSDVSDVARQKEEA